MLTNILRALSFLILAWLNSTSIAQTAVQEGMLLEFPERDPVDLGLGWDTRSGTKLQQTCIDFRRSSRKYQDKRLAFQVVQDNESLARALKVSVSGKIKAMTGGGFSGSSSFAHDSIFESSATQISVLAEVWAAPSYVAPITGQEPDVSEINYLAQRNSVDLSLFYRGQSVKLKPELLILANENLTEFFRRCGDSFVAVIHAGARINGLLQFKETTEKEKEIIAVSAEGSGGLWSAQGSLDSMMESFRKNNRLTVKFEQLGGSGRSFPLDKDGMIAAIKDLPSDAEKFPRPFTMIVQRYDSLPDWPRDALPRELSDQEVIANVYWRLRTMLAYADEVLYKPGWLLKFDTSRPAVKKLNDEIIAEIQDLRSIAKSCTDPKPCEIERWRDWSDMKYRVRLPFRGTLNDIAYGSDIDAIDRLPKLLAEARTRYWIEDQARWRCRYEQTCLSQESIDGFRAQIEKQVTDSIAIKR